MRPAHAACLQPAEQLEVYFRPSSGLERNFADDSVECGYVPAGILSTTKRR